MIIPYLYKNNFTDQLKMSSNERRLKTALKDLQMKLEQLSQQINNIHCLTIDGLQGIPFESDIDWKTQVTSILTTNHIYQSWLLNILNPTIENIHPNTITLQFINQIVRDKAYTILSNFVITNEYDTIISKDIF